MPLLRLVNQIVTMHQNVKETSEELKENRPPTEVQSNSSSSKEPFMRHKKSSSGSSTSSNISAQMGAFELNLTRGSDSSKNKNQTTPSPSTTLKSQLRTRPKSFAQKFRPNSRLAGYSSLESPLQEQHDSFILTSAPLEMITEEQTLIKCWKTMYNLLELYSTMPTTKTVQRQSLTPVSIDISSKAASKKLPTVTVTNANEKTPDVEMGNVSFDTSANTKKVKEVSFAKADVAKYEQTPFIVFGIVRIAKTKLMATLSGLKLEGKENKIKLSCRI